jgi:hypothetical protein
MLKIDVKRRDVGKIGGHYQPDDFDRPAHYEWGGKFFDTHGYQIVPGQPFVPEEVAGHEDDGDGEAFAGALTPASLLAQADALSWPQLKAAAQAILGKDAPKSKSGILAQLKVLAEGRVLKAVTVKREVAVINDPAAKPANGAAAPGKGGPKAWPPKIEEKPAGAKPASAPAVGKPGAIDLAAWGRGEVNLLNGQITKAAKDQYGLDFTERRDVLEMLVETGVVAAEEARADL